MTILDEIIDAFEEAASREGVAKLDPKQFVPRERSRLADESSRSQVIIELLRVWMEHRWQAGLPVTASDGLAYFRDESFSDADLELLQFEEQRQRSLARLTSSSKAKEIPSIDRLPVVGATWGDFQLIGVLGQGAFARVYLAKQIGMASDWLRSNSLFARRRKRHHWLGFSTPRLCPFTPHIGMVMCTEFACRS